MNGFEVKFNYEEKLNLIEKMCMKIKGYKNKEGYNIKQEDEKRYLLFFTVLF